MICYPDMRIHFVEPYGPFRKFNDPLFYIEEGALIKYYSHITLKTMLLSRYKSQAFASVRDLRPCQTPNVSRRG